MKTDTGHFKELLEKELSVLENELKTVGRKNPDNKSDWEAVEGDVVTDTAEEGDVAEGIEQYESNSAILSQLEIRLNEVKKALEKIEGGDYGVCEVGGEEIEEDRLEANPAATKCKKHMND
jgi:RNA polymerase-binding transcription factor DksA